MIEDLRVILTEIKGRELNMEKMINFITLSNWLQLNDLRQHELYTEMYIKYQELRAVINELTTEEGK